MKAKHVGFDDWDIDYIYHISDIHIRLYQRMKEYQYCFDRLYEMIGQDNRPHSIIVVTGDIVHSKNELSPECDMMTFDFLQNLSKLKPTLLIAGNHDALLNNPNRTDTLSSILHERMAPNLYFLKHTGVYKFRNLHVYVDSCLDKDTVDMTQKIQEEGIHIALYHGGIVGWRNVKGYISDHGENYMENFRGMDYVLLGDIHMFQYMSTSNPVAAYSGSLISQNFGETDREHGILEWDLIKKTQRLRPLENPYRFQDLYLLPNEQVRTDHVITHWNEATIAPFGQIKVYATADDIYSRDILQKLQQRSKKSSFHYQSNNNVVRNDVTDKCSTEDDVNYLLRDYVESHVSSSLRDDILSELSTEWTQQEHLQVAMQWNIRSIRFSNLFGYGTNNSIDFTNSLEKRTIGIFGENSVGKSTIIDILSLLLFDKVTRFSHGLTIPKEVIHFQEKEASGEICLQIGSDEYTIEKTYKRLKTDKIKLVSKFFQTTDGVRKELTGEQRKKTNVFIEQIIGRYDVFIYINSYLQQREQSFRDMSPSQKKRFLNELYGYHCFADMEKKHRELYRQLDTQYKTKEETYRKINQQILEHDETLIESEIATMEQELVCLEKKVETITKEKEKLLVSLQLTEDSFLYKRKEIEDEKTSVTKLFENQTNECQEAQDFLSKWTDHFLLQQWDQIRDCPLYETWKPSAKMTKQKWNTFYSDLQCHTQTDDTVLFSLRKKICSLFKTLNDSVILVDSTILEKYPLKNIQSLKKEYNSIEQRKPVVEESLKQMYNQLQFDISLLQKNSHYMHQTEEFKEKQKKIQSKKQEAHLQKAVYDNYLCFLKNESGISFLDNHYRYEKGNSLYTKFSPFQKGTRVAWEREFHRVRDFHSISVTDLRTDLQKKNDALSLLESQLNIPRGMEFPSDKVRQCQKELKKKKYTCVNCSLEWTSTDDKHLNQLEQTESKVFMLRTEIDMLQEMIHDISFKPNPKCNICLQNKDYVLRLQRQTKQKNKQVEFEQVSKNHDKLVHYFTKRFTATKDVHFAECLEDTTVAKIRQSLTKKKNCLEKVAKQTETRTECTRILKEQEEHNVYTSVLENFKNVKREKEETESRYHEICDFYSKKDVYQYLEVQWQWKDYLPTTMSDLQQIIMSYDQQYETLEKTVQELVEEEVNLQEEMETFEKTWLANQRIATNIGEQEFELKRLQSLKEWVREVSKYEELQQQTAQLQEIQKLEHMEKQCKLFLEHQKSIHVLCQVWDSPPLWNVNVDEVVNKVEKYKGTVQQFLNCTKFHQERITILDDNLECLSLQWKRDQENIKTIETMEAMRRDLKQDSCTLEKTVFEKRLLLRQVQHYKAEMKEQKNSLYDLQRKKEKEWELCNILDKDGLPLYLLRKKMAQMEHQMNELLCPFLPEKHVRFFIEQKSIEFGVVTTSQPDKMCNYFGGMETFIIELVVKLTFSKFSILPRSNFFIIDEGISVMDQQNISNISSLFQFLSNLVTNVLLISHIPQIQDFVDKSIYIHKKNGKSHVEFLNR